MTFLQEHWYLKDLQYEYLDTGYKIIATTDVPCHLWARMTTTPPRKHALPSYRRGLYLQGDIRFCFVVYEDNEQDEPGDTLTHTWYKSAWPICETRWFYFVGTQLGVPSVSESPIFTFHFPAPPPEPPPALVAYYWDTNHNKYMESNDVDWATCRNGARLTLYSSTTPPQFQVQTAAQLTASYWLYRGFHYFDTTALPVTAIVQSAILHFYFFQKFYTSELARPNFIVTKGLQTLPLETGDWSNQNLENVPHAQISILDINSDEYNSLDIDPAYLSWIQGGQITQYCTRQQSDVENIALGLGQKTTLHKSEAAGFGQRPILEIHYYPA